MLDFIRDIMASFRQASLERVRSPFLGAFVFSWLGFNWPMLAILFFSNRDMEKRIAYIFANFGIEDYLIGPICTSALIAYLLPKINKFVTKIQDKPNTETIEMSLESKIKIAKKQQEIAEIDAKKKLAEKKEERYIEEGIENIKSSLEKASKERDEKQEDIDTLLKGITDLQGQLAQAQSKLTVEQESKSKINNELIFEKNNNKELSDQIVEFNTTLNTYKSELNSSKENNTQLQNAYKELKERHDITQRSIRRLNNSYPILFDVGEEDYGLIISVNKNAKNALKNINASLMNRMENKTQDSDNA